MQTDRTSPPAERTTAMTAPAPFAAVVLAGGAARRLGGIDKPSVEVDGFPLLDRVLAACAEASSVIVVGPERPTGRPVRWTREVPPGGGPVPAVAAGMAATDATAERAADSSADFVVLLAADLPFLDPPAVAELVAAVATEPAADAAVYVDAAGREQLLASAFRRTSLAAALAAVTEPSGTRLAAVFAGLDVRRVPDVRGVTADCDTWDAITAARRMLAPSGHSGEDGRHGRHS